MKKQHYGPRGNQAVLDAKARIQETGAMPGEQWKDKKKRMRVGHPLSKRKGFAVGSFKRVGKHKVWVPIPFDNEGRRIIRVRKPKY